MQYNLQKNQKRILFHFLRYLKRTLIQKKINELKINGSLYLLSVKLLKKIKILKLPFNKIIQKTYKNQ